MRQINFHNLMLHCQQIKEDCLHCDRIEDCNACLRVIGKVAPAKWCDGIPQFIQVREGEEASDKCQTQQTLQ